MSDETKIEPVLTAEEWAEARAERESWSIGERVRFATEEAGLDDTAQLIAFANDALPADDHRKITREQIDMLRTAWEATYHEPPTFVDALTSYLPPEGT